MSDRRTVSDLNTLSRLGEMYGGRKYSTGECAEFLADYRILNESKVLTRVEGRIREIMADPEYNSDGADEVCEMLLAYVTALQKEIARDPAI